MNSIKPLITLLKSTLTVPVFMDVIPETQTLPAVAVTNISNASNRVLEGSKVSNTYVYRVTAAALTPASLESLLEELENLDNTSNNDFQRIFAQLVLREPRQPQEPVSRAFYDLTLYPR